MNQLSDQDCEFVVKLFLIKALITLNINKSKMMNRLLANDKDWMTFSINLVKRRLELKGKILVKELTLKNELIPSQGKFLTSGFVLK